MMIFFGILIAVVVFGAFTGLYVWTRRSERDEIDWESTRSNEDRQGQQFGIASNVNGTFGR